MDRVCGTIEPNVNVVGMALVVEEFLNNDSIQLQDEPWFQERAQALGLGPAEREALGALQRHIANRGATLAARLTDAGW